MKQPQLALPCQALIASGVREGETCGSKVPSDTRGDGKILCGRHSGSTPDNCAKCAEEEVDGVDRVEHDTRTHASLCEDCRELCMCGKPTTPDSPLCTACEKSPNIVQCNIGNCGRVGRLDVVLTHMDRDHACFGIIHAASTRGPQSQTKGFEIVQTSDPVPINSVAKAVRKLVTRSPDHKSNYRVLSATTCVCAGCTDGKTASAVITDPTGWSGYMLSCMRCGLSNHCTSDPVTCWRGHKQHKKGHVLYLLVRNMVVQLEQQASAVCETRVDVYVFWLWCVI
jgi:hypothetical protein